MLTGLTYHYNFTIIVIIIIIFLPLLLNPDLVCRLNVDQFTWTTVHLYHLRQHTFNTLA